jgi:citrate lyase subunit beta/citryl-CoA lyase
MSIDAGQAALRSLLFVPGNKARMLKKARTLPADAVILDLEDGVPAGEKAIARESVRHALESGEYGPYVVLRLNAFHTGLSEDDLSEAFSAQVDAVCLPKVETARDVERLASLLAQIESRHDLPPGRIQIHLMVETASGVLNAYEMARASQRVRALCLGGEDLARDLGAVRTKEGQELAFARAQMVLFARAAGAQGIDTIYTDLTDPDGLLEDASFARQLGYSGKLVIHPGQIQPVHQAFALSTEEIAYASRVLEAFSAAEERGDGVIALDGQMIDAAVVARAREILAGVARPTPPAP